MEAKIIVAQYKAISGSNQPSTEQSEFTKAEQNLLFSFGGYTRTKGEGCYKDNSGRTVSEPVFIYYIGGLNSGDYSKLRICALLFKQAGNQESVYFSFGMIESELV